MGCCTHPREFPLKDSETKLGNFSLKRLPSPPPPHTRLWPSRFLGWGNFLRPLHLRWGRFRFCRDSRRRRGRTVGVPVASFPRRGDPSSLPRPPGKPLALCPLQVGLCSPRRRGGRALPGTTPKRAPRLPGELGFWECPVEIPEQRIAGSPAPQPGRPRLVPADHAPSLGGVTGRGRGVSAGPVPAPLLPPSGSHLAMVRLPLQCFLWACSLTAVSCFCSDPTGELGI